MSHFIRLSFIKGSIFFLLSACFGFSQSEANAATARLQFYRVSELMNPHGAFNGVPGGGIFGDETACQINILENNSIMLRLERDPARHQATLKRRVNEVFRTRLMEEVTQWLVDARRMNQPTISQEEAESIPVLVNDCGFDIAGTGPAVISTPGSKGAILLGER
ncbi:hypothetical protein EBZ37_14015, partial [bacterium]|nr:hypothetical protein [bacterium]